MKMKYLKEVVTLRLNPDACVGCGRCTEVCPHGVFVMNAGTARIHDRDACMECGACARNCPVGAIFVKNGVGCAVGILHAQLGLNTSCCGEDQACCCNEVRIGQDERGLTREGDPMRSSSQIKEDGTMNEGKKKGVWAAIWESMTKTGGCCGGGGECGCTPPSDSAKQKPEGKSTGRDA